MQVIADGSQLIEVEKMIAALKDRKAERALCLRSAALEVSPSIFFCFPRALRVSMECWASSVLDFSLITAHEAFLLPA